MGCGARGFGSLPSTRAVPGLPPGPLGVPARSWLTFGRALSASGLLERSVQSGKQGPAPDKRRCWRAERRPRAARHEPYGLRFSARHPLKLRAPSARRGEEDRMSGRSELPHQARRLKHRATLSHEGRGAGTCCGRHRLPLPLWRGLTAAILPGAKLLRKSHGGKGEG